MSWTHIIHIFNICKVMFWNVLERERGRGRIVMEVLVYATLRR